MEFGDAVQVLRGIPIFSKLDPSKLKLLAFASDHLTFEDGEVLCREGEPSDCAYLIDKGEVTITAEKEDREVFVGSLGKNEIFGEMGVIRNSPRVATIRARGHVEVMRIDGDMFLKLVTENPDVALGVMRALSDKIARSLESYEVLEDKVRALQSVAEPSPGGE